MARLIEAATDAAIDSASVAVSRRSRDEYRNVQVVISAAANVDIEGRLSPDLPWVLIKQYTSSGVDPVSMFPEMRASVDSNTGTVTVELDNV